jgi:hypothetical protein
VKRTNVSEAEAWRVLVGTQFSCYDFYVTENLADSLLFTLIDSSFSELLTIVGHTQAEIDEILPSFRQQFLTHFFFAMTTFQPEEKKEGYLERLKKADFTVFKEMSEGLSKENQFGSFLYAFEEVYGGYTKAVGPALTEDQRKLVLTQFNSTYSQDINA